MTRYVLFRLVGLVAVLLVVSVITFALMHEVPGGPWKYGERLASEEQLAALRARYGLDKPVWQQYLIWLRGVLRFDFGRSFQHPDETVLELIKRTWPITLHLGGMALVLAFGIGVPLGIIAGLKQNTWTDHLATLLSIVGFVTPHFVWGILFILIFALTLKWLPTGGWNGPRYWIMPAVAYSLAPMATIARYTRASVLEVVHADYIRTARAKGLKENVITLRHMLPNALIPMITALAPIVPDLITGSIFVEAIFRVPGLGQFWVTSTIARDYNMVIGLTVLWAVLIGTTYLATDILYAFVDPRVRLQ